MFSYNNSTIIFLCVLAFYFIPMIVGYIFGKFKRVSFKKITKIGKKFGDPLTVSIHKWSRKYKLASMKNGKWLYLFVLIFLNNLLITAFVTRIVYGIVFVIPLIFTVWTGFGHGALFSKPKGKAGIILIFFEFGGYLFATVIGVKLGINILLYIIKGRQLIIDIPSNYAILMILFLLIGAFIETFSIKMASKNIDLSNIDKFDFDQKRKELADQLDNEQ
ncbi:MAG: stage II sporulation protein M [Halanaerobiales bacterium]|nr:stage II sporulation protein M [Halanaerobiales bacterium]